MARIQQLTPELVNQIAAGEVIERPASVVKELLENALDAGARRVSITLEGGGISLIRVRDDGRGIHPDDLSLAVASHATSKLRTAQDLFRIGSLGFRGEALSSVASVSRFKLASRQEEQSSGAELQVEGGRAEEPRRLGLPVGTTIEVADLFLNVPARRAFLKTERSELRAILAEVRRQALCRPEVHIDVKSEGKEVLQAPGTDEPRERIAQLLGRDLAEDLLALTPSEQEGVHLRGYVTPCDRSRGDTQQQFFFLNGRVVRDVALLSAVRTAYSNLLPPRRHPSVLLWLTVPPAEVDVNVHPQKAEVRFRHSREVFFLVKRTIETALREGGLVAQLPLHSQRFAGQVQEIGGGSGAMFGATALAPPVVWEETAEGAPLLGQPQLGRFLQIHRRYILEETDKGVRLLDPHALHERILYEEIRERLASEPLESQRFLFPQVVEVGPPEMAALAGQEEELARLGFEITPFGQNALAVHSAPRLLSATRVIDTVRAMLEKGGDTLEEDEEVHDLLHRLAASLACRSAVRFGEALSEAQIEELLAKRPHVRRGHCCPHGRPTGLALSMDELDRRFGRQGR